MHTICTMLCTYVCTHMARMYVYLYISYRCHTFKFELAFACPLHAVRFRLDWSCEHVVLLLKISPCCCSTTWCCSAAVFCLTISLAVLVANCVVCYLFYIGHLSLIKVDLRSVFSGSLALPRVPPQFIVEYI